MIDTSAADRAQLVLSDEEHDLILTIRVAQQQREAEGRAVAMTDEQEPLYVEGAVSHSVKPKLTFKTALLAEFYETAPPPTWPTVDVTNSGAFGHLHFSRGGACRHVRAEVIWPWIAGLVGLTIVDRRTWHSGSVVSLDPADGCDPETTEGLRVEARRHDGTTRTATLSVDELWTELERLAGEQS